MGAFVGNWLFIDAKVKMIHPTNFLGSRYSGFGMRNGQPHNGQDIASILPIPIYAAWSGVANIVRTGCANTGRNWCNNGGGNWIEITHDNGLKTRYLHLSKIDIRQGQSIQAGQKIGNLGDSGYSFGSHLHFEIIKNGVALNPAPYLDSALKAETAESSNKFFWILAGALGFIYYEYL